MCGLEPNPGEKRLSRRASRHGRAGSMSDSGKHLSGALFLEAPVAFAGIANNNKAAGSFINQPFSRLPAGGQRRQNFRFPRRITAAPGKPGDTPAPIRSSRRLISRRDGKLNRLRRAGAFCSRSILVLTKASAAYMAASPPKKKPPGRSPPGRPRRPWPAVNPVVGSRSTRAGRSPR